MILVALSAVMVLVPVGRGNLAISQEVSAQHEIGEELEAGEEGHSESENGEHAGDAVHGDHDPTDLSHQNAGSQIADPSEFKSDLAMWTLVVFLCLLALLGKFAWGPVMEGLEKREQGIADKIEEARYSAEQASKQLQQYEAKLAMAAEESREILAQARQEGESAKDRIVADAQVAANRERERAVEDITAAKNTALSEITEKSVDLAVAMARQLIQRNLDVKDQAKLIRDALKQIPSNN